VIAADYAWSGRVDPPAKLGYAAQEVFLKAYAGQFAPHRTNSGNASAF
jgi:hypothetical protein